GRPGRRPPGRLGPHDGTAEQGAGGRPLGDQSRRAADRGLAGTPAPHPRGSPGGRTATGRGRSGLTMPNLRHLVLIAIFGALWGALELSLGSALHALGVPFSGLFLAGVGIAVALVGYRFTRRRGSVVQIGLVAALLK